jgi:hypothetical protein
MNIQIKTTHLLLRPKVVLTASIAPVIAGLDAYFAKANVTAYVTSGLRDAEDQLRIIRQYLRKLNLDPKYPVGMTCHVDERIRWTGEGFQHIEVYAWQPAWSRLLKEGIIINPPRTALCLSDYYRNGVNRKGVVISPSPHFNGTAFDIGGGADGIDGAASNELAIVEQAFKDRLPGMRGYLAERNNNCVHVDCMMV